MRPGNIAGESLHFCGVHSLKGTMGRSSGNYSVKVQQGSA